MRLLLIPTLIGLALALTACSASTVLVGPSSPPKLAPPDSALTQACLPPIVLPGGEMTQRQIEHYWSRDRVSLLECAKRHEALNEFIKERDALLGGR